MATLTREDVRHLDDWTIIDSGGSRVGKLDDVYLDSQTGEPEWGVVKGGLFGMREHLVPLAQAEKLSTDTLRVPYTEDKIDSAPAIDEDGELSKQEEEQLSAYYGLQYSTQASGSGLETGASQGQQQAGMRGRQQAGMQAQAGGQAPEAMTRSEEELHVGTVRQPSELVRLHKTIVTEQVDTNVPVAHEEVHIEREPITEANIGKAAEGPALKEDVYEMTLMTEQPVVEKTVVPKERVRLEKETITDQQPIHAELRKEKIDVEREKQGGAGASGRAEPGMQGRTGGQDPGMTGPGRGQRSGPGGA